MLAEISEMLSQTSIVRENTFWKDLKGSGELKEAEHRLIVASCVALAQHEGEIRLGARWLTWIFAYLLWDASWIEVYWWPMPKKQSPWRPSFFTLSILPGSAGASKKLGGETGRKQIWTQAAKTTNNTKHSQTGNVPTCHWLFVEQELLESIPCSSPGFLLLYFYGMPNFAGEHLGFLMRYVPGSQDVL